MNKGKPIFNYNDCLIYVKSLNKTYKDIYHWVSYDKNFNKYFICWEIKKENDSKNNILIII
jgi:hypothetical protein